MRHVLRLFANSSGQITLSMALLALPLCVAMGSALDYGLLVRARSGLQAALDGATLAAAAKQGNLDDTTARSFFKLNGSLQGITISKVGFTKQPDGTVAGSVTASVPAVFMKIMRTKDYTVHLSSTARGTFPTMVLKLLLRADSAQGTYDKEIYYYAKTSSGQIRNKTLSLIYDYSYDPKTGNWRGAWGPPQNPSQFSWGLGETFGIMMIVYRDTSSLGQRINPDIMTTDDKDNPTFLSTYGKCTDPKGMIMNWEDSRDPRGDYRDFMTTLFCTFGKSGAVNVRLTN